MFMSFILCCNNVYAGYELGEDGELWNKFNGKEKIFYVIGFKAGMIYFWNSIAEDPEIKAQKLEVKMVKHFIDLDAKAIVNILDDFYGDYGNIMIPIPYALGIIKMKIDGASKEEIESEVKILKESLRKLQEEKRSKEFYGK